MMKSSTIWGSMSVALASAHLAQRDPGRNAADFTVYGFSQSDVSGEDPQVFFLEPDITIRAIGKWSTNGDEAADYNFAQIERYHDHNITFMGSGTASIIFPQDFPTTEIFDDMSTRDADGNPVPHDEFGFADPARRGNFFNPEYRKYLLDWAKIQVDGGVDGVNFDEVNAGFSGGQKYGFNGNEGFDDYAIADFNRYLLEKYPSFIAADWISKFNMTADNTISRKAPPSDLEGNFNYRLYLHENGWNINPLTGANTLAAEWGRVVSNRMYADDISFTVSYVRRYWKQLVDNLRSYAETQHGRRIIISSNGLWPYVDFNSVGMYPWNPDEQTADYRGADYVPMIDGHLNGAKSLQSQYRYLKAQNKLIAGNVPVAVFIDWPSDMMTNYQSLALEEKKDYWRIFGAEAYANGLFPSFHLKDTVGGVTAQEAGVLDFLVTYAGFYKRHRGLFRDNDPDGNKIETTVGNVATSLLVQRKTGLRTVHLVNHNYDGKIVPQAGFSVGPIPVLKCPHGVTMVSPDGKEVRKPNTTCGSAQLRVDIDRLDFYSILVLE